MSLLSFLIYALMLSDLVVLLFFNFLTDLLITSSVIFEFLYLLEFFHFNICVFRILSIEYWTEEFLPPLDLILFIMQDVSSVKIPHNCFVILCSVLICHLYYFFMWFFLSSLVSFLCFCLLQHNIFGFPVVHPHFWWSRFSIFLSLHIASIKLQFSDYVKLWWGKWGEGEGPLGEVPSVLA